MWAFLCLLWVFKEACRAFGFLELVETIITGYRQQQHIIEKIYGNQWSPSWYVWHMCDYGASGYAPGFEIGRFWKCQVSKQETAKTGPLGPMSLSMRLFSCWLLLKCEPRWGRMWSCRSFLIFFDVHELVIFVIANSLLRLALISAILKISALTDSVNGAFRCFLASGQCCLIPLWEGMMWDCLRHCLLVEFSRG